MTYRLWYKPEKRWSTDDAEFFSEGDASKYTLSRGLTHSHEVREYADKCAERSGPDSDGCVQTETGAGVGETGKAPGDPGNGGKRDGVAKGVPGGIYNPIDPIYYRKLSPEPIECIEGWDLGPHLANVVKYVSRYGRKHSPGDTADLHKAVSYLHRYISLVETGRGSWPPKSS